MNSEAVWTVVWETVAVMFLVIAAVFCAVAEILRRYDSLSVRVATTVIVLVALSTCPWIIKNVSDKVVKVGWRQEVWLHPSPIMLLIPGVVAGISAAVYTRMRHHQERTRVA